MRDEIRFFGAKSFASPQIVVVGCAIPGGAMTNRRLILTVFAWATLAVTAPSFAQSERGSTTGVVTDSSKAGIPGVSVKVVNTATNVTTNLVTSGSGDYSAP